MESFVFEQQVLFRVESLCDFQPLFLVPRGGARGQNLGHLKKNIFFSFIFHSWDHLYLEKRYYLELTSGYRVQCPRVGLGVKISDFCIHVI